MILTNILKKREEIQNFKTINFGSPFLWLFPTNNMVASMSTLPFGPTRKSLESSGKENPNEAEEVKAPEFEALKFDKVDPEALEESENIVIPLKELRAHLDDIINAIAEASVQRASEPEEFRMIQDELSRTKNMTRRELRRAKIETEDAPEISRIAEPKLERAISKLEGKVEEAKRFLRGGDFEEAIAVADVDIRDMKGEIDTLVDPLRANSYLERESPDRKGKGTYYIPF